MHLAIHYVTEFTYDEPARQSNNEVRGAPTTDEHQRLITYRVTTDPAARTFAYLDHWGTLVDAFGLRLPHDHLRIEVDAVVDTQPRIEPVDDAPLAVLDTPATADAFFEVLQPTAHAGLTDQVRGLARAARDGVTGVVELADRVVEVVRSRLTYQPGATEIGEDVDAVLAKGAGVCQDYAHLTAAVARAAGLPARYVSGYLYAADETTGEDDPDVDAVEVQTHAWVELAVPGVGWIARDPTNGRALGERHVKIGHGRDYDDVPPVRGVHAGGGDTPQLTAGVEMRRISPAKPGPEVHLYRQHQQQQQQSPQ